MACWQKGVKVTTPPGLLLPVLSTLYVSADLKSRGGLNINAVRVYRKRIDKFAVADDHGRVDWNRNFRRGRRGLSLPCVFGGL